MTAFIRGDYYCYSVSFILGHDCTAEFNKGIIITVFGGMFFESASNYENKIYGSLFQLLCVLGGNDIGAALIHN